MKRVSSILKVFFAECGYIIYDEIPDLTQFMMNGESQAMTHSNLERELEEKGRELMRLLLQEHLDKRAEQETEITVTDTEGEERNITKIHDRKLETVFGTVEVNRIGYGREGTDSLHPMDAELNLPDERYSLELRRRVAMEISKSSFDETIDHITLGCLKSRDWGQFYFPIFGPRDCNV